MRKFFRTLFGSEEPVANEDAEDYVKFSSLKQVLRESKSLFPANWENLVEDSEAAVIAELWQGFCRALNEEQAHDKVMCALDCYLTALEPQYNRWHSGLEPGVFFKSKLNKVRVVSLPDLCELEESPRLCSFLRKGLNDLLKVLHDQNWNEQVPQTYLYAIYLLGLKPKNISVFVESEIVVLVHEVFELATKLALTFTKMSPEVRVRYVTDQLWHQWVKRLSVMCAICLRIFVSILYPLQGWSRAWDSHLSVATASLWSVEEENEDRIVQCLELGLAAHSVVVSDSLINACLRDWFYISNALGKLQHMVLILVETVAVYSHNSESFFGIIISYLGRPKKELYDEELSEQQRNVLHFNLQDVVLRCISSCAPSVQHLTQTNYFNSLLDVLLWTSELIESENDSVFAAEGKEGEEITTIAIIEEEFSVFQELSEAKTLIGGSTQGQAVPMPSFSAYGDKLLDVRLESLFNSLWALVFGAPATFVVQGSDQGPNKEFVEMLGILFDLFNTDVRQTPENSVARANMAKNGVALQAHVLLFVLDSLQKDPYCVKVFRKAQIWHTLFSRYFFGSRKGTSMAQLQNVVWDLLEYVGTTDKNSITLEVKCSLNALSFDPMRASLSLCTFFLRNSSAMSSFDGRALLSNICNAISAVRFHRTAKQGEAASASTEDSGRSEQTFRSLIRLLGFAFCLMQVREAAAVELGATELLMQLLFDHTARYLSLDCILCTMETAADRCVPLFQMYMRVMVGESDLLFLRALLAGVRRTITRCQRCQKVWRNVGIFDNLITLLANSSKDRDGSLCVDVLKTLTSLQTGSRAARRVFAEKRIVVSHLIVEFLEKEPELREPLLQALFQMMFEGDVARGHIQNKNVLAFFYELWDRMDVSQLLLRLHETAVYSTKNIALLCEYGMTQHLLVKIPVEEDQQVRSKLLELLQVLGSYCITPQELHSLLQLFRFGESERPLWWQDLVKVLAGMLKAPHNGPQSYFYFDGGRKSYITGPSFNWPRQGFTFSAWISPDANAESCLFSFSSESDEFVELYWQAGTLRYVAKATTSAEPKEIIFSKLDVPKHSWFHVVVTHQNSGLLIGRSEVRLFIDGVVSGSFTLAYPQCSVMANSYVGCNLKKNQCFIGCMSVFFAFGQAISVQQTNQILALGPSYAGCFFPPRGDSSEN